MLKPLLESHLKRSGLSASEVARRAGLHIGTVSRWLKDSSRIPDLIDVLEVARVLRIPRRLILAEYGFGARRPRRAK